MKNIILFTLITLFFGCSTQQKEFDNIFYPFNNSVRTLQNPPEGVDAQAEFIKRIGFDGFAGHHSEDYFSRRAALDKVGLIMPEIYLPITINEDGSVTYMEGLYEIIKDSKDRNLVVALAALENHLLTIKKKVTNI